MNSLPHKPLQNTAKCNDIWRHASRVPDARKTINSTPDERKKDAIQFLKRLFKSIQMAPSPQTSASALSDPASKAPARGLSP